MFDKLVESNTAAADFKNRSRYFMVSSVVVGILFLTAVVYSLYAAEVGLGNGDFEIAELLSPVETTEPEREEPRQTEPSSGDRSSTPQRPNSNMARTDEPTIAPTSISTVRNVVPSRNTERFSRLLPISGGSGGPVFGLRDRPSGTTANPSPTSENDETNVRNIEPPPIVKEKPKILRKSEVLNGSAIFLPKPAYPKTAQMVNLEGIVHVQVTIDENGNVISAKAADGHGFFRGVAEQAARGAKFKPTTLNQVPVKVTGVIVYRFKRN